METTWVIGQAEDSCSREGAVGTLRKELGEKQL